MKLLRNMPANLKVCKLDVDANPDTAPKYNVKGIPTLILFKNGTAEAKKLAHFPSRNSPHLLTARSKTRSVESA